MHLRIGNYRHRIAEANVSISKFAVEDARGETIAVRHTWQINGKLYNLGKTQATMRATIAAFEVAYSRGGQDVILEQENGLPSYHQLRTRDCIGGTKITQPPQFPTGSRGEYVNYRSYSVAVEGLIPAKVGRDIYLTFDERISISGGGARYGVIEVNRGPGVRQLLRTHSKCVASQSGSASVQFGTPNIPPPIWPQALVDQLPTIDEGGLVPFNHGNTTDYLGSSISWTYNYEFPTRLFGSPHSLR